MTKSPKINVLFIADIVGKPGLDITSRFLSSLLRQYNVDFCIANGENAHEGKSITPSEFSVFRQVGIDVITSGNHIWDHHKGRRLLDDETTLLRPLNYPDGSPGSGSGVYALSKGGEIAVLNLQGRTFMYPIDCPFRRGKKEVEQLRKKTPLIIVDIHAEATAEKQALAWYLDGMVSAVIGTHTHVQTADERILPEGTAYISDAGMTGPFDSVIGLDKKVALQRFIGGVPQRYQMAHDNIRMNAVLVSINQETGKALSIERISLP
ncbi:metallophosphoesterase [candidate division LCP-89 bacterium B3_LCP]|uniref:Metallophosphoesterase n=1 Tax=candidate division LCP-89 bacterium B3_LCP TaxID=2012998 RepID=A0A532V5H0_UNCL8|nr:MAG: metallophosphoesterase [candidate division LCP-89 bacterium B3_LCP]